MKYAHPPTLNGMRERRQFLGNKEMFRRSTTIYDMEWTTRASQLSLEDFKALILSLLWKNRGFSAISILGSSLNPHDTWPWSIKYIYITPIILGEIKSSSILIFGHSKSLFEEKILSRKNLAIDFFVYAAVSWDSLAYKASLYNRIEVMLPLLFLWIAELQYVLHFSLQNYHYKHCHNHFTFCF